MQIMFGKVPQDDMDDTSIFNNFVISEQEHYYYSLTAGSEAFIIEDTCGRSIVLGLEDLKGLMDALTILDIKSRTVLMARKDLEDLDSDKVYAI